MKKKYIDADLIHNVMAGQVIDRSDEVEDALRAVWDDLDAIPAADVALVKHAHIVVNWLGDCHCSNCGESYVYSTRPFCPGCGARFDEPEVQEH